MDASINYLIKIIDSEIVHSQNVFDFLKEKEQILISNNIDRLKQVLSREHSFFVRSKELEASRLSVIEVIAKKYKIKKETVLLQDICDKLDVSVKNKINKMRSVLRGILLKVREQNLKCEVLIKKTIEIIGFSIKLMTKTINSRKKVIYDKNCQSLNGNLNRNLIDQRG